MHSKLFRSTLLAAAVAGGIQVAQAGQLTGTMFVSLSIAEACTQLNVSELSFGGISVGAASDRNVISRISVLCNKGTSFQVGIDDGQSGTGERRMTSFSGVDSVKYEIYRDAARTQRWGNIGTMEVVSGEGDQATVELPVFGKAFLDGSQAPGGYQDQVVITLSF